MKNIITGHYPLAEVKDELEVAFKKGERVYLDDLAVQCEGKTKAKDTYLTAYSVMNYVRMSPEKIIPTDELTYSSGITATEAAILSESTKISKITKKRLLELAEMELATMKGSWSGWGGSSVSDKWENSKLNGITEEKVDDLFGKSISDFPF